MIMNESTLHATALQCRRCLYTNAHPLGLTLDAEGICSGCRVHEEKDTIDWMQRWQRLKDLVAPYRLASGRKYDCIVPVTGANDSYFIVHLVKERLGLNPLLVSYNKYYNTPLGVRNLANLRIRFNCDLLLQNINPVAVKKITRATLRRFGSVYWHCLAGQTVFPVQTAVRYQVPLIIWGAHQGVEQVGMFSHEHEVEMSRRYRKDHDLMGYEADDLLSIFDTLTEDDILQYRYPNDAELARCQVRGIYLGNYVRWDPKEQHRAMVEMHGYEGAAFARTFDTYDHADCWVFMNLHDHLKQLKHGFGKVTDHACREIRHGRLSRAQGQALVVRYENAAMEHADLFCEWLGINEVSLDFLVNHHRNPRYWKETQPGQWVARQLGCDEPLEDLLPDGTAGFAAVSSLQRDEVERFYVTVGKGYPV
jgi:N-acetyl sugar amidotransferase